jgi:hypothetical protein
LFPWWDKRGWAINSRSPRGWYTFVLTELPIDLKDFDVASAAEAGSELTLLHPVSGEPLDIVITVAGQDSKRARNADRAITDMLTKEAQDKKLKSDDETFERLAATKAAGLTMGWSGIEWNGAEYPFTHENAVKLYIERRWIREQVERFAGQRANFFKPSAPNSAAA